MREGVDCKFDRPLAVFCARFRSPARYRILPEVSIASLIARLLCFAQGFDRTFDRAIAIVFCARFRSHARSLDLASK